MKKLFTILKTAILTMLLVLGLSGAVWAESVGFEWNANTESDLAGYKMYWGNLSGVYGNSFDVGNQTNYTVIELVEGQTYYFAATAYDTTGNESGYSDEVSYEVVDTTPPDAPQSFRRVVVEVSITEDGVRVVIEATD